MTARQISRCPVRKLTWDELDASLRSVNSVVADGFSEIRSSIRNKDKGTAFFSVRYEYGSVVIGPKVRGGDSQLLLKPCPSEVKCTNCDELLTACGDQLPLGIILTHNAEVYLDVDRVDHAVLYPPFVPLRILNPGDIFGIFEYLDEIACSSNIHRPKAQWRVSAGTRSLSISSPLSNQAIAKRVLALLKEKGIQDEAWSTQANVLSTRFDQDAWEFIKTVIRLVQTDRGTNKDENGWACEVLLIPVSWLHRMGSETQTRLAMVELLLSLYSAGWDQSLHLRQYHADLPLASGILAGFPNTNKSVWQDLQHGYIHRTLLHLVAIARGDLPGFVPVSSENEGGPFMQAIAFLKDSGLYDVVGLRDHFPFLLQAHQLRIGKDSRPTAIYYSLDCPTLLGPVAEPKVERPREAMITLHTALSFIKDKGHRLGGIQSWRQLTTNLDWPDRESNIRHFEKDDGFLRDFKEQIALAKNWNQSGEDVIKSVRGKFLTRCLRLEVSNPAGEKVAKAAS